MGSGGAGRKGYWSVYDTFKSMPPTPECLMAEVDAAIAAVEYAQTIDFKSDAPKTPSSSEASPHDVRIADEAYRAACGSLASSNFESALASLRLALANCPPDKSSAIAKIQSLISIASQRLAKIN